jgi:hypothetical protein
MKYGFTVRRNSGYTTHIRVSTRAYAEQLRQAQLTRGDAPALVTEVIRLPCFRDEVTSRALRGEEMYP